MSFPEEDKNSHLNMPLLDEDTLNEMRQQTEKDLEEQMMSLKRKSTPFTFFVAAFVLGSLNNLGYVMVNSAAKQIATDFNQLQLMPLIPWLNIAFGSSARSLNSFLFLHVPHSRRVLLVGSLFILGFLGVAFSAYISFVFALLCILVLGSATCLGESVILGFLRDFSPELVGGWSSGTGMAGVLGSGLYLLFSSLGVSNVIIFSLTAPLTLVYWSAFFFLLNNNPNLKEQEAPPSSDYLAVVTNAFNSTSFFGTPRNSELGTGSSAEQFRAKYLNISSDVPADAMGSGVSSDSHADSSSSSSSSSSSVRFRPPSSTSSSSSAPYMPPSAHNSNGHKSAPLPLIGEESDSMVSVSNSSSVQFPPLSSSSSSSSSSSFRASNAHSLLREEEGEGVLGAKQTKWKEVKHAYTFVMSPAIQLAFVYFFEYVISIGFQDHANSAITKEGVEGKGWAEKHAFEILSFCYQIGVLISRSSLSLYHVQKIMVITTLQGINWVGWFILALIPTYSTSSSSSSPEPPISLWLQFAWMIFVGLMGGASYVNTMYIVMNNKKIPPSLKELSLNLVTLHIDGGIFLACGFMILINFVIFK